MRYTNSFPKKTANAGNSKNVTRAVKNKNKMLTILTSTRIKLSRTNTNKDQVTPKTFLIRK